MLDEQRWSSKGTFLLLPPMSHQKSDQSTQALVRKSMETKSKMAGIAAILDEWWSSSSKGTFIQSPPMSHQKIGPVDPGIGQKIDGHENGGVVYGCGLES
jgi:hypothetical protein